MAKKSTCRCKASECEECPEWIFTFADLVMLMMGFFVILWVTKPSADPHPASGTPSELVKAEASIREAFGYIPKPASNDPVDILMLEKMHVRIPDGKGMGGKTTVRPLSPTGTDPESTAVRPGPHAVVGGRLNFDAGDDKLSPAIQTMLDQIAEQVRGHRNLVLVKGHTSLDDTPEAATAGDKMALSLRRAQAVADYLTAHGVEPEIVRVQGCSTFEPVVERDYSTTAQEGNRRVEVETTASTVGDFRPANPQNAKFLPATSRP